MKNLRLLFALVALCAFAAGAPKASAEAKAYDLVNYKGKAPGLTIAFGFASGYAEASTLKVTTAAGKTIKFRMDSPEKMHFVPATGGAGKEVTLQMGTDDDPPEKVEGTYKDGDKSVPFTLTKGK
jgi:hypothetical protein